MGRIVAWPAGTGTPAVGHNDSATGTKTRSGRRLASWSPAGVLVTILLGLLLAWWGARLLEPATEESGVAADTEPTLLPQVMAQQQRTKLVPGPA